jgi:hypothetical protein
MSTILWVLGVLAVIGGVFALLRREFIWGAVLIVVGMALGGFGFFG